MATTHETITAQWLLENAPEQPCELVRGELYIMVPAGFEHGRVVTSVARPLSNYVYERDLGVVTGAETGFLIERNPDTVRAPDVAFVTAARVPEEPTRGYFGGAPDLAVEILSPHDTASAVNAKVDAWLQAGCQAVWLIDPVRKAASACVRRDGKTVTESVDSLSHDKLLPGFELTTAEIFD